MMQKANQMQKANHILVTGGTGFIGAYLCRELCDLGWNVTVVTRDPGAATKRLPIGVNVIAGISGLPDTPYSHVVNLAGESLAVGRWNSARKAAFRASRIITTQKLFAHFQHSGNFPEVLISGSAIGFYGNVGDSAVDESQLEGKGFAAELCKDWEAAAEQFRSHGTCVCLLRTGVVLGKNGGALARMLPAFRFGLGGRLGDGTQWMSWIHIKDLVRLIVWSLNNNQCSGPLNGVSPNPVTNADFTLALSAAVGRPALLPMPKALLGLLMGEMADELLLASQRVLPELAMRQGFTFAYPKLADAIAQIIEK